MTRSNKIKKSVWILCMLLAGFGKLFAQTEDPFAKERAQIREIKLSNHYYYSDVSSSSEEDTRAMARQLVVLAIQQEEPEAKDVAGLVADSCRYIELKRIDRPRIFAYISKETVAVWLYRKKHPEAAEMPAKAEAATPVAAKADTVAKQDTVVQKPAAVAADTVVADTVAVVADSVAKDTVLKDTVVKDTVAVVPVPVQVVDTVKESVVLRDTMKVTVQDTLKVTVYDTARVTVTDTVRKIHEIKTSGNERLDRIIAMKTISQVQTYFVAEKKAGRMMFGKMDSVVNPEKCYLLIFSRDGKVVAVLNRGKDSRVNLTTGKAGDSHTNYPGHGVIWFLLY